MLDVVEERREKQKEEGRRKKMNKSEIFMFGFLDFVKCEQVFRVDLAI